MLKITMKRLDVKKVNVGTQVRPEQIPEILDNAGVSFNSISEVNWNEFPYKPEVSFRIAYTDDAFLIQYLVDEETTRAKYGADRGSVWTDSCVEFFSSPVDDGYYYNLETNCIGTVLLCCGKNREGREYAPTEVTDSILRYSTLGNKPFDETVKGQWSLSLFVPFKIYFKHNINNMVGRNLKANFYKCGDELKTPHFLSWNPIEIEKPDFHRPDYFGELKFV